MDTNPAEEYEKETGNKAYVQDRFSDGYVKWLEEKFACLKELELREYPSRKN
jgi:hypothetical protein